MSSINPLLIQMSSLTSSLKILIEGSGILTVNTAGTSATVTNPIPHNFGSDELLWQVGFSINYSGTLQQGYMTPYITGDGQVSVTATVDNTNLYVTTAFQTAGTPGADYTISYYYRVLVP